MQQQHNHHVVAGSLLALFVFVLPQVQVAMAQSFDPLKWDQSGVASTSREHTAVSRPIQGMMPARPTSDNMPERPRGMPPELVVAILFKAGVIAPDKLDLAHLVLQQYASNGQQHFMDNGTSTNPFPPRVASSTRPKWDGDMATSTMRIEEGRKREGATGGMPRPPMPPQGGQEKYRGPAGQANFEQTGLMPTKQPVQ